MSLPKLPNIKQLSPHISRILGQNPGGFTLQGTNTYLIGSPSQPKRLLVDTGEGRPEYIQLLEEYLKSANLEIGAILITHWHADHSGGLQDVLNLGPVPVYKYPSREAPHELEFTKLGDGQQLTFFGTELRILHTPGHTDDHLVLWVENDKVMLSTDNVLGHGTSSYTDYAKYMASLERMLEHPDLSRIFPGHGEVIEDGPAKIREYIAHRLKRENQVLEIVSSAGGPVSSKHITEKLYADIPPHVQLAAQRGVDQFLLKLVSDGKIKSAQEQYSKI